jgi:hypothetical protein
MTPLSNDPASGLGVSETADPLENNSTPAIAGPEQAQSGWQGRLILDELESLVPALEQSIPELDALRNLIMMC